MRNIHHHSADAECCGLTSRRSNFQIRATCRKTELLPLCLGRVEHADLRSLPRDRGALESPAVCGSICFDAARTDYIQDSIFMNCCD